MEQIAGFSDQNPTRGHLRWQNRYNNADNPEAS
jgi:hypothetical protein